MHRNIQAFKLQGFKTLILHFHIPKFGCILPGLLTEMVMVKITFANSQVGTSDQILYIYIYTVPAQWVLVCCMCVI